MEIFVKAQETAVIACGVQYLRIEGSFYCGIGCLFLLYGYYRAINKAQMSVVLTVISLGLRVVLAYILSVPLKAPGICKFRFVGSPIPLATDQSFRS